VGGVVVIFKRILKILVLVVFSVQSMDEVGIQKIVEECIHTREGSREGSSFGGASRTTVADLVRRFGGSRSEAGSSEKKSGVEMETQTDVPLVVEQETQVEIPLVDIGISAVPMVADVEVMTDEAFPAKRWVDFSVLNAVVGNLISLVKSQQANTQILFDNFQFFFKLASASTIEFRDALNDYFKTGNLVLLKSNFKVIEDKFIHILDQAIKQYGYVSERNEVLNKYLRNLVDFIVLTKDNWNSSEGLNRVLSNIKSIENDIYKEVAHLVEDIVRVKDRMSVRLPSSFLEESEEKAIPFGSSELSVGSYEFVEVREVSDRDIDTLILDLSDVLRGSVPSSEFSIIVLAKVIYLLDLFRNIYNS
jgi:hypothetical protein